MVISKILPTVEMSSFGETGSLTLNTFDAGNNHGLSPNVNLVDSAGESVGNFTYVNPGLYDLTLSKRGYFSNHRTVNIASGKDNIYNLAMRKADLGSSDLAVTMTWDDGFSDLDLHVMFKTNTTESCHVFFNHKECGGAKLEGFSLDGGSAGGEAIKFTAGPSYYLFYAKASVGSETPTLSQSGAHIDIYSSASDEQLVHLDVPSENPKG